MHRIIVQPFAEQDIADAAIWYEQQRSDLGHAFLREIHAGIRQAAEHPRAYRRLRRTPEVRRMLTRRFPYAVFYIVESDKIVIFRVLHAARHEREWNSGF